MTETITTLDCCIIAAVNDDNVLDMNLADSEIFKNNPHFLMRDYSSASEAYNDGIKQSKSEIMIFSHQDVYLPKSWEDKLIQQINAINKIDTDWAVIGIYGVEQDGTHVGQCWSSGLSRLLGGDFILAHNVCSIDELVIIVRRSSGICFDEKLPGFHLYGTDIVQIARSNNLNSYVVNAPVIHNSKPVKSLLGGYKIAYFYMRKKWKSSLPLITVIVKVTSMGLPLIKLVIRMLINQYFRKKRMPEAKNSEQGKVIAKKLGFE